MDKGWLHFLLGDFLLKRMGSALVRTARAVPAWGVPCVRKRKTSVAAIAIRISSHDTA